MQCSSASITTLLAGDRASLPAAEGRIHTPYVLIIDDDRRIVDVIQSLLEIEGFNGVGISDSLKVPAFLNSVHDHVLLQANCRSFSTLRSLKWGDEARVPILIR